MRGGERERERSRGGKAKEEKRALCASPFSLPNERHYSQLVDRVDAQVVRELLLRGGHGCEKTEREFSPDRWGDRRAPTIGNGMRFFLSLLCSLSLSLCPSAAGCTRVARRKERRKREERRAARARQRAPCSSSSLSLFLSRDELEARRVSNSVGACLLSFQFLRSPSSFSFPPQSAFESLLLSLSSRKTDRKGVSSSLSRMKER